MDRNKLIKMLTKAGFILFRHGGSHDIYIREMDKEIIPRHRDINENLAKSIIKKWGLK